MKRFSCIVATVAIATAVLAQNPPEWTEPFPPFQKELAKQKAAAP